VHIEENNSYQVLMEQVTHHRTPCVKLVAKAAATHPPLHAQQQAPLGTILSTDPRHTA
jgi:hypothetical protein